MNWGYPVHCSIAVSNTCGYVYIYMYIWLITIRSPPFQDVVNDVYRWCLPCHFQASSWSGWRLLFPTIPAIGFLRTFRIPHVLAFHARDHELVIFQPHVFDKIIIFPSFSHHLPTHFPAFSHGFPLPATCPGVHQVLPSDDNPDVVSWRGWKWWIFHYGLPEGTGKLTSNIAVENHHF